MIQSNERVCVPNLRGASPNGGEEEGRSYATWTVSMSGRKQATSRSGGVLGAAAGECMNCSCGRKRDGRGLDLGEHMLRQAQGAILVGEVRTTWARHDNMLIRDDNT